MILRIVVLLVCLFCAAQLPAARGQTIIITCSNGTQSYGIGSVPISVPCAATVTYSGPGDIMPGATVAYLLRAYTAAIAAAGTQPLINIIRASDSHACDVLVATSGGIGLTANCSTGANNGETVATFCTTTTCSVEEWYDQSGNGANASQPTVAVQPQFVISGLNGLPTLLFSGGQALSATISSATVESYSSVVNTSASMGSNTSWLSTYGTANNSALQNGASGVGQIDVYGGAALTVGASNGAFHAVQALIGAAGTAVINVDGTETTGTAGAGQASTSFTIGTNTGTIGGLAVGQLAEGIAWPSFISSGNRTALRANQKAYWGTP